MKEKLVELRNNKKAIVLFILLLMSVCIGISYAYWHLTLVQNSSNAVASSCFKITFTEESNAINLSTAYPISDEDGRKLTPYSFTITNECEEFAEYQINLEVLEDTTLSSEYIKVLLNEENAQVLTEKEMVETTLENATTSYKLKAGYLDSKESITYDLRLWMDYDTPAIEETMNKVFASKITITATYTPYIPSNMLMKGPDFEIEYHPENILQSPDESAMFVTSANVELVWDTPLLTIDSNSFWQYSNQIISINFETEMNPLDDASYTYDVSEKQDGSILAYLTENDIFSEIIGGGTWYDLHIQTDGEFIANSDFSGWFAGMMYLLQINGLENVDTSNVIDMSNLFAGTGMIAASFSTYEDASDIPNNIAVNIPIDLLNTSNVTDMSSMFAFSFIPQISDNSVYMLNLDTSNVENMSNMFLGFYDLFDTYHIDISNWNTSKVMNMSGMFGFSVGLETINLRIIDTSNVTDFSNMFAFSENLLSLDVSNFSAEKAEDMSYMFYRLSNVSTLDIQNFETENVTNMAGMFAEMYSLTSLDVSNFITTKVTDMFFMFGGLKLENFNLSTFDTSNVTNMSYMFASIGGLSSDLEKLSLTNFNTENVVNMEGMFGHANINSLDISSFNTENVTNFRYMFSGDSGGGVDSVVYGDNFVYRNNADVTYMFDTMTDINKPTDSSWEGII